MQKPTPKPEDYSINELNDLIETIKKRTKLNEEDISKRMGYNEGYISQTRSRKKVPPKLFNNLLREFRNELNESHKQSETTVSEPEEAYSGKAVLNLTESNRLIAESNASLADSNKELVQMVKRDFTASDPQQSLQDAAAMRLVLLELLSEVGSGKRWKSPEEVRAVYRKRIAAALGLTSEEGTHGNSDRKNTVKKS